MDVEVQAQWLCGFIEVGDRFGGAEEFGELCVVRAELGVVPLVESWVGGVCPCVPGLLR